ncbi:MAG: hydrogenase expression/formation protein HypE [Elusimicrobiota bacterium]|jgi:hydrogenase expression/formation protein HypE
MTKKDFRLACPTPAEAGERVTLAHGSGGRHMHKLVSEVFRPLFKDAALEQGHDGAALELPPGKLAFSTDSFVIRPIFFPGGDIGSLCVHGTANDLAMCGARPLYLSCACILEEGFPLSDLRRVAESLAKTARAAGMRIVTGDTKVVERGKGDGIYVNTAGIGLIEAPRPVEPRSVLPGDALIVSGDVGAHGAAVLSVREGLSFETTLLSDAETVWPQVRALLEAGVEVHCLRDLTRGGLATALNEIAEAAKRGILVEEAAVPVRPEVASACELFGLDPFYMACEGRFAAFVPERDAQKALAALRGPCGAHPAALVGRVVDAHPGEVRMNTRIGVERILDMLSGEQLPRIC